MGTVDIRIIQCASLSHQPKCYRQLSFHISFSLLPPPEPHPHYQILLSIQLQKVPISRVGIVAQCVKPQPVTPASHIWVLLHVLATSFPVQLPANMPGKGAEAHPSAWTPATHVGDLDALLDCWSSPDPALAIVVIWEPNQQMDNLCLPVTLSNKFSKVKVPTSSLGKPSQNASISSRIAHVTFHTYQ